MHPSAWFDRGLDHFAILVDDVTAPVKDVAARSIGTILANNESLDRLVIGRRAFLTCHFDDGSGHRYCFGGTCPLPFALRLWLRERQRCQQCAADEDGNWFLHVIPPLLLLASLKNFLADASDRERTLKRGGAQIFLPLHEEQAQEAESLFQTHSGISNEDRLFDRSWAEALVAAALERLSADYRREAKEQLFKELRIFIAGGAEPPPTYADLTDRLGIIESTLRSHVTRLRARYREALRTEVRRTVDSEKQVESRVARVTPRANGNVRNARHGKTAGISRRGLLDMRQAVERKRRLPGLFAADGFRGNGRRT